MSENENEYERATISMPSELLTEGKKRARQVHRTFSSYVTTLVESDLKTADDEAKETAPNEDAA